jgi:ribosomal protein S6--L-glutamate ligase
MKKVIALEARLRKCRNVTTLGVRPNFSDYSPREADLIRNAQKIYYPSIFYAELFDTAGIATFPSYNTYKCAQDKIKQTALFNILEIPHPRTHVFYGGRQQKKICDRFSFPFIAKIARGSAMGRGVFFISDASDLEAYLAQTTTAYIQKYLKIDRDMRVVVIGGQIAHAYWRIAPNDDFRSNVAVGGHISLDPLPPQALELALSTALKCGWDDVGIDICESEGTYYVLEGNVKYGREGFRAAGIDYHLYMEKLIENGTI